MSLGEFEETADWAWLHGKGGGGGSLAKERHAPLPGLTDYTYRIGHTLIGPFTPQKKKLLESTGPTCSLIDLLTPVRVHQHQKKTRLTDSN